MVIGVDLEKDERTLYDAYNDSAGVTARFNLNVLERINRELGGNFDLSGFIHRSIYNKDRHRIEMHLISRKAQSVRVLGHSFSFRPAKAFIPRTATNTRSSASPRWRAARAGRSGILDRQGADVFGSRAGGVGLSGMSFRSIGIRSIFLFEHDLFGKPVPTFPDHALTLLPTGLGAGPLTHRSRSARRRDDRRCRNDPVIGNALPGQQPGVNDAPFVPSAGRKIQERRTCVLKLDKELQGIFSGGAARLDLVRSNPAVPLVNNLVSGYSLLHRRVFPATT